MKDNSEFEDMISKDLDVRASDRTYHRLREVVLDAHGQSKQKPSAARLTIARRTIMKSRIVKLAVAAVVIVAVVLGLFELLGTESKSGVVWADVVKKIETTRGLIYRESHPNGPDEAVYIMFYDSPTHARIDTYKNGQLTRSLYCDYDARTILCVAHDDKICANIPMEERDVQDHQREMHLKGWVEEVLSRQHTNLGRRTIGGVLCEGIETKYPIFGDADSPTENSARRVWVSVETGYPLLCEAGKLGDDGKLRVETVLDQFQWDVELDASEFEPNIPPDYEQM
jgi:hypothetical protein